MSAGPSFGSNVAAAVGITAVGVSATSAGAGPLGLYLMAFLYLGYLLYHSPRATGRVALMAGWLAGATALYLLEASMSISLMFNLTSLWLARCWCYLDQVLQALADLALWFGALALACAALLHSGSYPLAIWTFFLVQALWPWVAATAASWTQSEATADYQQERAFNDAKQNAEAALRRLQTPSSLS